MPHLFSKLLHKGSRRQSLAQTSNQASLEPAINAVYYPNWAVYRPKPPSAIELDSITHVLYAFVWPNADGTLAYSDSYADHEIEVDGTRGCLRAITQIKHDHPHIKVLLSVGGGGTGSQNFAALAKKPDTRRAFASSLVSLFDLGFDGLDIDWEHPSNSEEKANYLALFRDLRKVFPRPLLLTSAIPAPPSMLQNYPINQVIQELDFVFLMAYDFSGPWTDTSGHHAQLVARKDSSSLAANAISGAGAVAYLTSNGVPAAKIVLGIPVYGRFFPGAGSAGRAYNKPISEEKATIEYNKLPQSGALEWVDKALNAAYSVGNDGFVSYDNKATVTAKGKWARSHGLAGLFYWTTLGDKEGDESLIRAGYASMQV